MVIFIASDHGGFIYKQKICRYFESRGIKPADLGTYTEDDCDYPDFAHDLCQHIINSPDSKGILVCGTGIGMSMAANRHKGIRAVVCHNRYTAEMARKHNNANVLCMGARVITLETTIELTETFLSTAFEPEERHIRRIGKIEGLIA